MSVETVGRGRSLVECSPSELRSKLHFLPRELDRQFHFHRTLGWVLQYQPDTQNVRMEASVETPVMVADRWRTRGRTTLLLEENGDGEWRASQRGVDVTGRGKTAALAAAAYCERVADDNE